MDELTTAPEPQATEPVESAAPAADLSATGTAETTESAATTTAPTQSSEPDIDRLIEQSGKQIVEKLRKRPDFAGMLGRDEQRLKREQEERLRAEAYQQALAQLRAQEDEARRRREIEEMPDEDYGRYLREQQRQDALKASLADERDRTWVETLGQFLDDEIKADYHRPGRWQSMADYVKAVMDHRIERELAARTETDLSKIRAEIKEQVLQEMQAERRAAMPGSDLTSGIPVGAKTLTLEDLERMPINDFIAREQDIYRALGIR